MQARPELPKATDLLAGRCLTRTQDAEADAPFVTMEWMATWPRLRRGGV